MKVKLHHILLLFVALLCSISPACAHADTLSVGADSIPARHTHNPIKWIINRLGESNKKAHRPFDFGFVAGPSYDPTASFGIGACATGLYKWDRQDSTLSKSNVTLTLFASIKGMVNLVVSGENYLPHDRFRLNYKMNLGNATYDFWGLGYDQAIQDANKGQMRRTNFKFRPSFTVRLARNLYAGPCMDVYYDHSYRLTRPELLAGRDLTSANVGAGLTIQYDSRDFNLNAFSGHFLRIDHLFFPKFGSRGDFSFQRTDVTYSTYHRFWPTGVWALGVHGQFCYSDIPWQMYYQTADSDWGFMRGYYAGRFNDRNVMEAQLELRQHVWKRLGVVAFAGLTNIFHDFDHVTWHHTLPSYGTGIRWEFKPRVNVRVDVGFGRKTMAGVVFNINEAF